MKNFWKNNKYYIIIAILSILALITGIIALGYKIPIIVVSVLDLVLFLMPTLMKKKRKENKKDNPKKRKKGLFGRIVKWFFLICFSLGILLIILGVLFFYMIAKNAPEFDPENLYTQNATILYDNDGEIIAKLGTEKREKISYNDLPEVLVDAIIATEDSKFFEHNGIDLLRFVKASALQLLRRPNAGGASTLTMQVAKNGYTDATKDEGWEGIKRKFTDIYLAVFKIEKNYTKEEIIEFYVNSYCLGGSNYGVEQASQAYFGKSVSELNLSEAAIIAGLFQMPNGYNPLTKPDNAAERRSTVLYLMVRHGYITEEERQIAESIPISELTKNASAHNTEEYIDFIDTVVEQVNELTGYNPYTTPMEIYTTMDREKQDYINKINNGEKFKWENDVVQAGIAVVNSQTGAIVAIGAGRNRTGERSFNFATMIYKQIGSTSKPLYDYGPAIEYKKISTGLPIVDEPYEYSNGKEINNWDSKFKGLTTAKSALSASRNIPALKVFKMVSREDIKNFVLGLGLHPENDLHEAHSIGGYGGPGLGVNGTDAGENPLSMASAYAAFANGGYYNEPYSFTKIIYRESGEKYEPTFIKRQVMSSETAYMVNNMLIYTTNGALGDKSYVKGYTYGAKTGTTNYDEATIKKYKLASNAINDLWVIGLTDQYSIGVWYGYKELDKAHYSRFGNSEHRVLFQTVAKGIFERSTKATKPANVVSVTLEKGCLVETLPSAYTPENMKSTELFIRGTEPTIVSDRYAKLDSVTNLSSSYMAGSVTLTWTPIATPNAINIEHLRTIWAPYYTSTKYLEKALTSRTTYNEESIGIVGYDIYTKAEDGTLTLIGSTSDSTFTHFIISTSAPITYVVKTAYTIFKDNASDGAEIVTSFSSEPIISYELNGVTPLSITHTETYTDAGIKILSNGDDITNLATITTSVLNSTQNFLSDGTDIPLVTGTYYIRYIINYGTYSNTVFRTVIRE